MASSRPAILVLLLALISGCADRATSPVRDELDTSAFGPTARKQIDEALARASAAPESAEAQGDLGRVLHAYRLHVPAAEAYAGAVELAPEVFRWRYLRGRALAAAGRQEEATVVLTEALALRSDYSPLRVAIGNLLLEAGDHEAAYGHYRDALELDPLSAQAHLGIGKVLASRGESEAAVDAYRATLEIAPGLSAAHYGLGLLHRDLGETELAAEQLALAERARNRKHEARDVLMSSVARLAGGARSLTKEALRHHDEGRTDRAIVLLLEATEKDPAFVPARVNLIQLYSDVGRFEAAEKHYRAAIAVSPNAQQARFNWARSLVQQQRLEEAVAELEAVVEINPNQPDAQVLLGSVFDDRGEPERAAAHYRLAIESDPGHPQANLMLALHGIREGDLAAAEENARRLLQAKTESLPILIYRLAASYAEAGETDLALGYYGQARRGAMASGRQRLVAEIDSRVEAMN